jgi:hypothetical protein
MSAEKLSVFRCEECGKQHAPKEEIWAAFHRHDDGLKPYEEVEVIPVEQAEQLEADLAKAETVVSEQEAGLLGDLERVEAERDAARAATVVREKQLHAAQAEHEREIATLRTTMKIELEESGFEIEVVDQLVSATFEAAGEIRRLVVAEEGTK